MARTRPSRAETRAQVLEAAFTVFGERGIAGTSLTEVASAAGLTKGAVYSSFASKDDLVLALMEEHAGDRIRASLEAAEAAEDSTGEEVIADIAAVLVQQMRADATWHRLLAEYFALAHHDPARRDALRQRRREVREAVTRALERIADALGLALPLPPSELAVVILALSNGLAVEGDIDSEAVPDDLLAQVLTLIAGDAVGRVRDAAARVLDGGER